MVCWKNVTFFPLYQTKTQHHSDFNGQTLKKKSDVINKKKRGKKNRGVKKKNILKV